MNSLPLFYYPSTWLYVDDDKLLLESMSLFFREHNFCKCFASPESYINYLSTYQSPLTKYSFLNSITGDEWFGVLKHNPIDFDITKIAELADDPNRYNEITAIVLDYKMPNIDGFSLAKNFVDMPIQKILLTGKAQNGDAIEGFNNNLIHRFVLKSEVDMEIKLLNYLKYLTFQYFQTISTPLLSYLEIDNQLPLTDNIFISFFEKYCVQNNIVEYYLIDKQGSFLCIDNKGFRSLLVVQTDQSIDSWLEIYGVGDELSINELEFIKRRKKVPFFGVGKEAWNIDTAEWYKHLYEPKVLKGRKRYLYITLR